MDPSNPTHYGATNNNINGKSSGRPDAGVTATIPGGGHRKHNDMEDVHLAIGDKPSREHQLQGTADEGGLDEDEKEQQRLRKDENRLDTLCVVGFCLGLIGFLSTFHLKIRDLLRPRPPYPLVGNIQDVDPSMVPLQVWEDGVNIVPVLWGLRYIRKIGLTLFHFRCLRNQSEAIASVHPEESGKNNCCAGGAASAVWWRCYILPVILYHLGLSVWVGLATNYHLPYHVSDLEWVIAGIVVFLVGELMAVLRTLLARRSVRHLGDNANVNCCCPCGDQTGSEGCWSTCRLRRASPLTTSRVMEAGEVLSCAGFAIFTLTLPACLMAIVRLAIAIPACMRKLHGKPF